MEGVPLRRNDLFRHVMPGGGGWGDPLERDPVRVLEDVLDEKLTVAYVRREYGVVIDPERWVIDREATERLRSEMRRSTQGRSGEINPVHKEGSL
jgi:N-methylhydantoinase B